LPQGKTNETNTLRGLEVQTIARAEKRRKRAFLGAGPIENKTKKRGVRIAVQEEFYHWNATTKKEKGGKKKNPLW